MADAVELANSSVVGSSLENAAAGNDGGAVVEISDDRHRGDGSGHAEGDGVGEDRRLHHSIAHGFVIRHEGEEALEVGDGVVDIFGLDVGGDVHDDVSIESGGAAPGDDASLNSLTDVGSGNGRPAREG